ncbi:MULTISPECIES: zinc-dependent metalloprotease [Propionimicrobium]|uniref:zinc-dependent metalloprotease n=1 Tax=Propionimicrobium TaxID=203133 RepID=UPI0003D79D0E|nr:MULTISPECIES: zinc-dependent metalloprotease [Propionimicrobium]ETJ97026.1 coenzyme F420 biosynthesis-associated protein [Propionimicrobium sp. BV2F7]
MINWQLAADFGKAIVPIGKPGDPMMNNKAVGEIRAAARKALPIITEVTQLPETGDVLELVVDRKAMVEANVATAKNIMGDAESGLLGKLSEASRAVTLGGALALLAPRILGQYVPYADRPMLLLNAPTIVQVEEELKVNPQDFRLWVALHEQTHRVQFANAPWLREYLVALINEVLEDDEKLNFDVAKLREVQKQKANSLDAIKAALSPQLAKKLDSINAIMGLLEGHADFMMDAVGAQTVPSVRTIRRRFQNRRKSAMHSKNIFKALLNRLLGMDAKLAQYQDGARFCRAAIDEVGVEGLNLVWEKPENLPTADELKAPMRWLTRVAYPQVD